MATSATTLGRTPTVRNLARLAFARAGWLRRSIGGVWLGARHEGAGPLIRRRLRRPGRGDDRGEDEYIEIDPGQLAGLFAAPNWLRDAGFTSWLLVGVVLLTAGVVTLLSLTAVIVIPLIVAGVVA